MKKLEFKVHYIFYLENGNRPTELDESKCVVVMNKMSEIIEEKFGIIADHYHNDNGSFITGVIPVRDVKRFMKTIIKKAYDKPCFVKFDWSYL